MRGCCRTSSDFTTLSLRSFQTTSLTSSRLTISDLLLPNFLCCNSLTMLYCCSSTNSVCQLCCCCSHTFLEHVSLARPCCSKLSALLKLWLQLCLSSASSSQFVSLGMNSMHITKLYASDWTLTVDCKLFQHLLLQQYFRLHVWAGQSYLVPEQRQSALHMLTRLRSFKAVSA